MRFPKNTTNGFHVESLNYFYAKEHKLIGLGDYRNLNLQNIGEHGKNLTIAVLSMNQSSLTVRLLNSMKKYLSEFEGEFLIGDNGSHEDEKQKLRDAMKQMPFKCRMVEFDKNYGVARGRNKLFAEVQTEWILSMDNDLYFVGNPLAKIQKDLWILGCHFMTLPIMNEEKKRVDFYGSHLYIGDNDGVGIGGGSAIPSPELRLNQEYTAALCTYVVGGSSIFNKKSFFEHDGFDNDLEGIEDIELSIRLYQCGMKVGTCGITSVIRDDCKTSKELSSRPNQIHSLYSCSPQTIRCFEGKHGFSIWNPMTDNRLEKYIQQYRLHKEENATQSFARKKKIALVVDRRGWAFDNVATVIARNLSDEFEFIKIYLSDFDNLGKILILADDCQMIHFFWRPLAACFYEDYTQNYIRSLGMKSEEFYERYVKNKEISVEVYDHLLLSPSEKDSHYTEDLFSKSTSLVTKYCVSSKKLWDIYQNAENIKMKPSAILADGVDTSLFMPQNLERFDNIADRKVVIGWVGNSKWTVGDLKGINTIIRPAVKILQEEGYNIELMTSDRQDRMIPHDEMPAYYNRIDLYICASSCEGTPNPVLEAMACGVPVISTDVGIVPEVFGEQQKKFILEERSVRCLADALMNLLKHPEWFAQLSKENLFQIKFQDWKLMTEKMRDYFR